MASEPDKFLMPRPSDLRYHWVRQKRLQGSHGSNDEQARAYNQLVYDGKIDPCRGEVYSFEQ